MSTTFTEIETDENGVKWIEISGTDYWTSFEFGDKEVYGVTEDKRILDCDGTPLTPCDINEIAVRNALGV